ncbi:hypothetical protein GcM3_079009 [Golovinomyces cichoracearum]|uniref:Uncharacterized protein n=1 Tax=Golovinomyces cichoracearum TaxID=62708 RepID=A0A420IPB6_9PEZI|nr:hypothetical protein GcM3_079009 [Golovinomyces cichoracearum]
MNTLFCPGGLRSAVYTPRNVCFYVYRKMRMFSTSLNLKRLGAVPKMSGVSNPELQERLTKFREVAVLPKHLAKNQQDLVFNKRFASMLENEKVIANISGEEFRLKHINVLNDIPRIKLFLNDILPLMKEKEDWSVLPNVLQGLKNTGFKMKLPIAEKVVRLAGINGRQNVILECLRRTKHTGMNLNDPDFTKTVLFWIHFKAVENDKTVECISKSLSMAEQILEMLEDEKFTGTRYNDTGSHQLNHPEILGVPLSIAALKASKFKDGKDKNGLVAKYATQFVCKSMITPLPSRNDEIEQAKKVKELEDLVENLKKAKNSEELIKATKSRNFEREALRSKMAKWLHWMMLNTVVVNGIKKALPILDTSFQHKPLLVSRLVKLEKQVAHMESLWREVHAVRGKDPQRFIMSKLLQLNLNEN